MSARLSERITHKDQSSVKSWSTCSVHPAEHGASLRRSCNSLRTLESSKIMRQAFRVFDGIPRDQKGLGSLGDRPGLSQFFPHQEPWMDGGVRRRRLITTRAGWSSPVPAPASWRVREILGAGKSRSFGKNKSPSLSRLTVQPVRLDGDSGKRSSSFKYPLTWMSSSSIKETDDGHCAFSQELSGLGTQDECFQTCGLTLFTRLDHMYVIRVGNLAAGSTRDILQEAGIGSAIYYPQASST